MGASWLLTGQLLEEQTEDSLHRGQGRKGGQREESLSMRVSDGRSRRGRRSLEPFLWPGLWLPEMDSQECGPLKGFSKQLPLPAPSTQVPKQRMAGRQWEKERAAPLLGEQAGQETGQEPPPQAHPSSCSSAQWREFLCLDSSVAPFVDQKRNRFFKWADFLKNFVEGEGAGEAGKQRSVTILKPTSNLWE